MNSMLSSLIKKDYSKQDLRTIRGLLESRGALEFKLLESGLFPAAMVQAETAYTGYASVWLRDNVHVANAHAVVGKTAVATKVVTSLLIFLKKQSVRFERIIRGETSPNNVMDRPHIRFDGNTLSELEETWAHAQNDALGYFLWLYFKLAAAGHLRPTADDLKFMTVFPRYFKALPYWADEDSGHWEETRKIEASSIGAVIAGLRQMREYWKAHSISDTVVTVAMLDELIAAGTNELNRILPCECIQPGKERECDGALLFLIYPLELVDGSMADTILRRTKEQLQGEYGIRRYLGDSFWFPNYKSIPEKLRTADYSNDVSGRDAMLPKGQEAQWCIFDSIVSTIYGRRYAAMGQKADLELQTEYFNRALSQVTEAFQCPELYYLEQGKYVHNDATPLLWTQANLMTALWAIEQNAM